MCVCVCVNVLWSSVSYLLEVDRNHAKKIAYPIFSYLLGSAALELTPAMAVTDFLDASEVKKLVQLNGYFNGSSSPWSKALENVMQHDIGFSALGGLISHLSRLMVCFLLLPLPVLNLLRSP